MIFYPVSAGHNVVCIRCTSVCACVTWQKAIVARVNWALHYQSRSASKYSAPIYTITVISCAPCPPFSHTVREQLLIAVSTEAVPRAYIAALNRSTMLCVVPLPLRCVLLAGAPICGIHTDCSKRRAVTCALGDSDRELYQGRHRRADTLSPGISVSSIYSPAGWCKSAFLMWTVKK